LESKVKLRLRTVQSVDVLRGAQHFSEMSKQDFNWARNVYYPLAFFATLLSNL